MKRCLLIEGGFRCGDITHLIPLIRSLAQGYEITWLSGTFAQEWVKFLATFPSLNIKQVYILPEHRKPGDISDRIMFKEKYANYLRRGDFDLIIDDPKASFEIAYQETQIQKRQYLGDYPEFTFLNLEEIGIERKSLDYISVQPDSISGLGWKRVTSLFEVEFPLPAKSLGWPGEKLVPNADDCRGLPIKETAKLLYQSALNVCIHSSLACLSFYLNKPTVVLHFFNGQMKFSRFHENVIDLVAPTKSQIEEVVKQCLMQRKK